jgi:hypothetical protein
VPAGVDVHVGADVMSQPKAMSTRGGTGFTHPLKWRCGDAWSGVHDLAPEFVMVAPQSDTSSSAAMADHIGGQFIDDQDEVELGAVGQTLCACQTCQGGSHAAEMIAAELALVQ